MTGLALAAAIGLAPPLSGVVASAHGRAHRVTVQHATGHHGGLSLRVTTTERTGARSVLVQVDAVASDARGGLGYSVSFGDGHRSVNSVPQLCTAQTRRVLGHWRLRHVYAGRGVYVLRVTVHAGCGRGAVGAHLRLRIG